MNRGPVSGCSSNREGEQQASERNYMPRPCRSNQCITTIEFLAALNK